MENTYTFTARSAEDSAHVATFTLFDHSLEVDAGPSLAQIGELVDFDEDQELPEALLEKAGELPVKPAAAWLMGQSLHPFSIADVDAEAEADHFHVQAWVRAGGRRLAPVRFSWDHVDNPDASNAFVEELERRKLSTDVAGRRGGPLDYWLTWVIGGLLIGTLAGFAVRKLRES